MNKINRTFAVAAIAIAGFAGQVSAASISMVMDRSTQPGVFPDGGDYMQVTISDGEAGAVDFRVEILDGILNNNGNEGPPGITAFSFNFGDSGASINNIVAPQGWNVVGKPLQLISSAASSGRSVFERISSRLNQLEQAKMSQSEAFRRVSERLRHRDRLVSGSRERVREMLKNRLQSLPVNLDDLRARLSLVPQLFTPSIVPETGISQFGMFDANLHIGAGEEYDPLQFSIVGVDGDSVYSYASSLSMGNALRGNTLFAAQVEGLSICNGQGDQEQCIDMAAFGGPTTVVPLPPALALMLSGIAILSGMSWRNKRTAKV